MVSAADRPERTRGAPLRWLGPLPAWSRPGPAGLRLEPAAAAERPAILRFDHDGFMEEYLAALAQAPERLGEWFARPETWRDPMPAPAPLAQPAPAVEDDPVQQAAFLVQGTHRRAAALRRRARPATLELKALRPRPRPLRPPVPAGMPPLKLYQASQQRHYLVCASLVQDRPGLPEPPPAAPGEEEVGFVVRRLLPPAERPDAPFAEWEEYAFLSAQGRWQRLGLHGSAAARRAVAGEERLPLFVTPLGGACSDRRLYAGSIPVNRREAWLAAPIEEAPAASEPASGPGLAALLLHSQVIAPWQALLEQAAGLGARAEGGFDAFEADPEAQADDRERLLREARDRIQTGSWYVLLDLARLLREHLPALWEALRRDDAGAALEPPARALLAALRETRIDEALAQAVVDAPWLSPAQREDLHYGASQVARTLAEALLAAEAAGPGLEAVDSDFRRYDAEGRPLPLDDRWPDFLFPLADPELAPPLQLAAVQALGERIEALLPADGAAAAPAAPPAGEAGAGWFVLRCLHHRPACGPLRPPLLSEASEPFQLAAFFDPDAPARPVRIPMPVDVSPAGLRKYQKNTAFVISDMLCGKLGAVRRMSLSDLVLSVLPWPFHKDLPDLDEARPCRDGAGNGLGMICSFSIPIVTLCALVLMMIMVALFDLVFRWLPYLLVCLPVPGLRGKKGEG